MKLIITVILNFIFILSCQIVHAADRSTSVTIDSDKATAVMTLLSSDLRNRTTAVSCRKSGSEGINNCSFDTDKKQIIINQPGLYEVTLSEFKDNLIRSDEHKIIWIQQIYVPTKSEAGDKDLAEKYMPAIVFHKDEEYFPVSLNSILDFGASSGERLDFRDTIYGSRQIPMGQSVKNYLTYNGHSFHLINLNASNALVDIDIPFYIKIMGDKGESFFKLKKQILDNAANCNTDNSDCKPHFLRGLFGDPKKPVVYWEVSRESGKTYVTYHFFYAFDPKIGDMVDPADASHIFDRESFTVVLNQSLQPESVIYPGHLDSQVMSFTADIAEPKNNDNLISWNGGKTRVPWSKAVKAGNTPVIYKAQGAHAIYPTQGYYRVQQKQNLEDFDLTEEAGSQLNSVVALPEQLELRELDLSSSELKPLAFSGYWIDVIGGAFSSNARFTPFTGRAPYAPWSETARFDFANPEAKFEQTSCFDLPKCKQYFDNIYGLDNYGAIQVVVEDPGMSVNLIRGESSSPFISSPFSKSVEYRTREPKTVFYEAGQGSLSVLAKYPGESLVICVDNLKSMIRSDVMLSLAPAPVTKENQIPLVTCGRDTDGDGERNSQDLDDDNDGFSDKIELTAGSDPLNAEDTPDLPSLTAIPSEQEPGKMVALTLIGGDATKFSKVVWSAGAQTKQANAPDAFAAQTFVMAEQDMTVRAKLYDLDERLVSTRNIVIRATDKIAVIKLKDEFGGKLNDTGVELCANFSNDPEDYISISADDSFRISQFKDCSLSSDELGNSIPYGQDSHFKTGIANTEGLNNSQGMEFSKGPYDSYSRCVIDNNTNLMWQNKISDGILGNLGINDADDLFSWFDPRFFDLNEESYKSLFEVQSPGRCFIETDAINPAPCNTHEYIRRVNEVGLCGYHDWRLPNIQELQNLTNYSYANSGLDRPPFKQYAAPLFWSSSIYFNPDVLLPNDIKGFPVEAWTLVNWNYTSPREFYGSAPAMLVRNN